jgi:hypothetical protein
VFILVHIENRHHTDLHSKPTIINVRATELLRIMLAARVDQENAVHARQTAAAAKPLNQGVKGFAPKTPGNRAPKTPFKVALNDENEVDKFGKGGFGTNGKGLGGKQQGGKVEKNLFQTPAREATWKTIYKRY